MVGDQVVPISPGPGLEAVWSRHGRELFYRDGPRMMAVEVDSTGAQFNVGRITELFSKSDFTYALSPGWSAYDVSLDGQRFLMVKQAISRSYELILVLNWFEELKARVPID